MNTYYVDPSQKNNGNGSIDNPFNSVNAAFSAGVSFPWTVLLKKGTSTRERLLDDGKGYLNNSGRVDPCFFGSYGEGPRPKWIQDDPAIQCVYSTRATNVQFRNIDFIDCDLVPTLDSGSSIHLIAYGDTGRNNDANIYVDHCGFIGNEHSVTAQWGGNQRIKIFTAEDATTRAHKIGVSNCNFDTVSAGIYIRGNTQVENPETNVTGDRKSMGVFCSGNSFHRVVQTAALFHSVKSKSSAYIRDEYSSYIEDNHYSSYRWDKVSPTGKRYADAAIWTWHCDRIMIQRNWVAGCLAMANDGMAIDFDGMCWECVARHNFSTGNVSFFMFVSGGGAGLTAWDPNKYSYVEWYYNRKQGSGNNIVEYNFSFNDAIQRLKTVPAGINSNSEIAATVLRNAKCQFNNTFRNNTIIDTVSDYRKLLVNSNVYTTNGSGVPALIMANNIFYCRWLGTASITEHNKYTNDTVSNYRDIATPDEMIFSRNIMFSEQWAGSVPDMSKFTNDGNIFSTPRFSYLPPGAPVNSDAARLIGFKKSSPALNGGVAVSAPDINGNSGNSIGWIQ